jgi:hypothetical protein
MRDLGHPSARPFAWKALVMTSTRSVEELWLVAKAGFGLLLGFR